jgi:hypothetical protein
MGWVALSWTSVSMLLAVWRKYLSAVTLGNGTLCGNQSTVKAPQTPKVLGM